MQHGGLGFKMLHLVLSPSSFARNSCALVSRVAPVPLLTCCCCSSVFSKQRACDRSNLANPRSSSLNLVRGHPQVRRLELELAAKKGAKVAARTRLRSILKAAAAKHQQQLKHPSSALRISWMIDKGMWTMLADGEPFAEAEINNMVGTHGLQPLLGACWLALFVIASNSIAAALMSVDNASFQAPQHRPLA
jgi:hypothetical protein